MSFGSGNRRAAEPEGAPGDLGILQAFLNTVDLRKGVDRLRDPQALADWLVSVRLLPPETKLADADLERTRTFREGLRSVLVAKARGRASKAGDLMDQVAYDVHLRMRFAGEGTPASSPR